MRTFIGKSIAGVALASMVALTAAPADAQRYRRHHDDDAGWAIGAGILGLGVGAAIASSSRNRGYYGNGYNGGYYGNGYSSGYYDSDYYGNGGYYGGGYSDRGYYGRSNYGNGYAYGRACGTHRVWDDYSGRWIRVRSC